MISVFVDVVDVEVRFQVSFTRKFYVLGKQSHVITGD